MEKEFGIIFNLHGIENADKTYPGLIKNLRALERKFKRQHNESFTSGYLAAVQAIAIACGEDTIAEIVFRESGIPKTDFLKYQKLTGYYTRKMNRIIKEAFRKKGL